jgi:hypothetical protein
MGCAWSTRSPPTEALRAPARARPSGLNSKPEPAIFGLCRAAGFRVERLAIAPALALAHGHRLRGGGGGRGGAGRRGGGAPESLASTCGSVRARASESGRGSSASKAEIRSRRSASADESALFPDRDKASEWRRRSSASSLLSIKPPSARFASSCDTAGPDTPVRRASSDPDTSSVAIARSARNWATVSGGSCTASKRSIQRLTSGATATSVSAARNGGCRLGGIR